MTIRVDRVRESSSHDMGALACRRGMIPNFSRPGKPIDNVITEAVNSKARILSERALAQSAGRSLRKAGGLA